MSNQFLMTKSILISYKNNNHKIVRKFNKKILILLKSTSIICHNLLAYSSCIYNSATLSSLFILGLDIHYEKDTLGSKSELIK